ncbi:uncharacterized protein LOC117592722 [Esox lucius]|uniref:uncharacterized protein LOC117592722 n=1 Tax=Esox lucius TaxID=8010 RepID=UPI00147731EB|nr:uncharacterized protein LOC117592722 [Esox lucius]
MAATELQRGLERPGRGWGTERGVELQDSFDSEMQEWEDQLQDMQRKIEKIYNEVQARRGGNDIIMDHSKIHRMHHGNGFNEPPACHSYRTTTHPRGADHYSKGPNHGPNGYGDLVNQQNGSYNYSNSNSAFELGDLLQDYLGHGHGNTRKTNVALYNITNGSHEQFENQDEMMRRPTGNDRIGQVRFAVEEAENRKNRVSHRKSSPCRDLNKENTGAKPPIRQREGPPVPPRSTSQMALPETAPALDRTSHAAGILVDRKSGSPSVLRKFGAMLQENEGKTLTDTGVVTNQAPTDNKCPTPICQRKGLVSSRAPGNVPVRKCQVDSIVLTAEMEGGSGGEIDSRRDTHLGKAKAASMGSYSHPKEAHSGSQRRTLAGGSPKPKARAQGGAEGDTVQGEPRVEYRNLSESHVGAQMIRKGGPVVGQSGLIELLDMLDIEHEYRSSPRTTQTAYSQGNQQLRPDESSLATHTRNFSRPSRPANQRPPSRWACRTPTALISAPSSPVSHPPSPLAHTPSPVARTPSPALKKQSFCSYLPHTETVIM